MSIVSQQQPMMLGLPFSPFDQPISALAPRSVNVQRVPRLMSADGKDQYQSKAIPFAQRRAKQAPIASQAQLKESRRQQLLEKVRNKRDEGQFERRADDMLRSDFLQRKKEWEDQQARLAEQYTIEDDAELIVYPTLDDEMEQSQYMSSQLAELEQEDIEQQELKEMEAMLALFPDTEQSAPYMDVHQDDQQSEHYGSDDGDELGHLMDKIMDDYDVHEDMTIPNEEMDLS